MKILIIFLLAVATAAACPFTVNCPADGQQMYKVGDDYAGVKHLAIYEHTTVSGLVHRVTVPCDK